MKPLPLCPAPAELTFDRLSIGADAIVVHASATRARVPCPECGTPTARVHSRYTRTLADLPWHGTVVRLRVRTRRFFCAVEACAQRIFAERLAGTAARYARRTHRCADALAWLALAVGGRAGERLAHRLALGGGKDTLLRFARAAAPDPAERGDVRVLGVDEWAWRKGRRYGTILVDLERRRVVDLLPDAEADTLVGWLETHPGVEVVSRDRSRAVADAVRRGAPDAMPVADRWHLLKNLREAVERALEKRPGLLRETARALARRAASPTDAEPSAAETAPEAAPEEPPERPPTWAERAKARRRERRLAEYERVVALGRLGRSLVQIADETGLNRKTVKRWLEAGAFPERQPAPPVPSKLDPYKAYLERRVTEDECTNAARLFREVKAQGYPGGRSLVTLFVQTLRPPGGRRAPPRPKRPSVRRTAWMFMTAAADLEAEARAWVDALTAAAPELARLRELALTFRRVLADADSEAFERWLADAAAAGPVLRGFVRGLREDLAAVRNAVRLPWSNGPVEGQNNRLKLVKRRGYGRTGFELLRAQVLAAA